MPADTVPRLIGLPFDPESLAQDLKHGDVKKFLTRQSVGPESVRALELSMLFRDHASAMLSEPVDWRVENHNRARRPKTAPHFGEGLNVIDRVVQRRVEDGEIKC